VSDCLRYADALRGAGTPSAHASLFTFTFRKRENDMAKKAAAAPQEDTVKVRLERVQKAVQESLEKAEQNLQRSLKDIGAKFADAQHEAKKRLDEVVAELGQSDLAHLPQDALLKVNALREELSEKLGPEALWNALGLATKNDFDSLSKKLNTLAKKVKDLEGAKRPSTAKHN